MDPGEGWLPPAIERAFLDFGGVPQVLRHDNLKAAVIRACLYDPDLSEVYEAFGRHWGFIPLPARPRHLEEDGIAENSGGYVKDNALKGRRFDSLEDLNAYLQRWNHTIARRRIHGTTRTHELPRFQGCRSVTTCRGTEPAVPRRCPPP